MKYQKNDPVLVYSCPCWFGGGCGIISAIDASDPNEIAYLVVDVVDKTIDRWVKEEYLFKLTFTKPTFWGKIKWILKG